MKKKFILGALIGTVVLGGAVVVGAKEYIPLINDKKELITLEKAESIALSKFKGNVEEVELEREHGKLHYKIELDDDMDTHVYIDAVTGDIVGNASDDDDDDFSKNQINNTNIITKDEAIKLAEKAVGGKVYSYEKELDDGIVKYELELRTNKGEVDIEINAVTGDILEIDYED